MPNKSLVLALLLTINYSSNAVSLIYDEEIDGDLSSSQTLEMGVGANIVSGTLGCTITGDCDFDLFSISFAEIVLIESIELSLVDLSGGGNFPGYFRYSQGGYDDYIFSNTNEGGYFFLPIKLETDQLGFIGFNALASGGTGFNGSINDYTIAINVSQVPLPTAAWLLGSALLGLAGVKRNKQSSI
ncbi:putative secreted protein [Sinobacterium caligoides]|uniref:Putative secreted protein n=1 Tax=Sinobacterium caligoides TaxID=933926 RepID=A0A3N2DNH8_9GAMM|nr:VPLPA-CTERM sorting domain-containing protein [Sinobacterium caligoides]ROS01330.1 putative secreted protein [Sinobacterium caligoides]